MLTLLCDPSETEHARESVLPLLGEAEQRAFDADAPPDIEAGATVVAYLPDAALAHLLPMAANAGWRLGLLPHPKAAHARAGFGLAHDLKDAAADLLAAEGESEVDLLTCNGRVVLGSVVIGDPLTGTPGQERAGAVYGRLTRLGRLLVSLFRAVPLVMELQTAKERRIETAALGLVCVEHGHNALLSRRLVDDTAANDGMLHALVYAPRSVLVMLWFVVLSILLPARARARLPGFVGHIKTESLTVRAAKPVAFRVDGVSDSAAEITLAVRRAVLSLIPGRHLEVTEGASESKEIFRVEGLLSAEMIDAAKARRLPWLFRATPEEFKSLFQLLRENARTSESYLVLMVLSTMLATFGLFADSAPVIIGAMVLAPLMSPIISMSMGVLRTGERALLFDSLKAFGWGVAVSLVCAVVLTWLTPLRTVNSQIAARLDPTLLDMGIAVASGIAGAYAHAREHVARSLAGVAIAVALVPPLAVTGIGIGWADWRIFSGAGLLFLTNIVGMVLAAAATFLVMGFSPFRFSRRGLGGAAVATAIVTALLIPSFARMVDRHRITDTLDGWSDNGVELRDIAISSGRPVRISVTLLSDRPVTLEQIDAVRDEIAALLGREIRLEARVVVVR
ncbi:MAG: TIGR00341 family protein [Phycisphaerales bacterium]|nr:TIGR00341 family protein [Planctomycetota bacterium]MCH8509929.1 TIGR00341 family protein [Phycisphaerales bacterium]